MFVSHCFLDLSLWKSKKSHAHFVTVLLFCSTLFKRNRALVRSHVKEERVYFRIIVCKLSLRKVMTGTQVRKISGKEDWKGFMEHSLLVCPSRIVQYILRCNSVSSKTLGMEPPTGVGSFHIINQTIKWPIEDHKTTR